MKRKIIGLLMLGALVALGSMPALNCNVGSGANCKVFCS